MDKQLYKPRMTDRQLEEYLSAFGAGERGAPG